MIGQKPSGSTDPHHLLLALKKNPPSIKPILQSPKSRFKPLFDSRIPVMGQKPSGSTGPVTGI